MEKNNIISGRNPVLEYIKRLKTGETAELFISEKSHGKIIETIKSAASAKKIKISLKDKDFFAGIGASSVHQGAVLILKSAPLPAAPDENSLLEKAFTEKGVLVLLDRISDPRNTGAIIRTTEALGGTGLLFTEAHTSGINPTVIKSSAGATAHLPALPVKNAAAFLARAKERGFWIIGSASDGNRTPDEIREYRPCVLIIGSEGDGMRRLTRENCDICVSIPLKGSVASLNASVAAGIILHALLK